MTEFDKQIKMHVSREEMVMPSHVSKIIDDTLEGLPEKECILQTHGYLKRRAMLAASFAIFFLVFMPNLSVMYAQTLQHIPIIGDIIKVFTIRKELYENECHELNADIPTIENEINDTGVAFINKDIEELTTAVIQKFYEDVKLSKESYGSIYIDYEIITNDTFWFTLKLNVDEVTGSSNSYAKIYHIDRKSGNYVKLKDILSEEGVQEVKAYILDAMKEQMEQDETIAYFIEDDIEIIHDDSNFYFNENQDLVIVYNKYDVAPGYMGCPEFVIPKDIYKVYMITK